MTEKAIEKAEKILNTNANHFHIKTPFFDRKIKTLFTRFDFDHNGKIEKQDFDNWSKNLVNACGLTGATADKLQKSVSKIWEVYFLPADTNHDGSVEYLELLDHMKAALRGDRDDPVKRKAILDTLPLIFQAIDTNNDGSIATEEFQVYFQSFGLDDEKFTTEIFKVLDTNHDFSLSQEEFVAAGTDFFMGLDDSGPSKYFFGPLV